MSFSRLSISHMQEKVLRFRSVWCVCAVCVQCSVCRVCVVCVSVVCVCVTVTEEERGEDAGCSG